MNGNLTWIAASRATGWYACERRLAGLRVAPDWREVTDGAAADLLRPLHDRELPASSVRAGLRRCVLGSADEATSRPPVELFLEAFAAPTICSEPASQAAPATCDLVRPFSEQETVELAARLERIAQAFAERLPRLAIELPLRAGPLREQWEARGPGLLRRIARLASHDTNLDPALADTRVLLVHPVCGGGGWSADGAVVFEAMLYNDVPALPEILRLGWLLAQTLGLGDAASAQLATHSAAHHTTEFASERGGRDGFAPSEHRQLALLPIVLAAGEYVELTRFDPATLKSAAEAWCGLSNDDAARAAERLDAWWRSPPSGLAPAGR